MDFIALYTDYGVINLRADQIRSFEYINEKENLIIDDGTEGTIVISDSDRKNYNRLCTYFGTQPMEGSKENGKKLGDCCSGA